MSMQNAVIWGPFLNEKQNNSFFFAWFSVKYKQEIFSPTDRTTRSVQWFWTCVIF